MDGEGDDDHTSRRMSQGAAGRKGSRAKHSVGREPGVATLAALSFALGTVAFVVPVVLFLAIPRDLIGGLLLFAFGPLLLAVMLVCALAALALGILNRRGGATVLVWLPGVVVSSLAFLTTSSALAVLVYVMYVGYR